MRILKEKYTTFVLYNCAHNKIVVDINIMGNKNK